MITPFTLHITLFVLLSVAVDVSRPVCVDVLSNTEAVVGKPMKLTCIFCMKREEVSSKTRVDWFFLPRVHENTTTRTPILQYVNGLPREVRGPWEGRLLWAGSTDLQDLSIHILNVTWDDGGIYQCQVFRQFEFDFFSPSINKTRTIDLRVIETARNNTTAVYSEIMMYVLLVFLTFWLLLEMVYCYRKISKSDEQQETAKDYVALPSETHRDPRPVPLHVVTAPVIVTVTVTPHGTDLRETELLVLHPYAQLEEAELYT